MAKKNKSESGTFTLVIWWEIPENLDLYLIPNSDIDEDAERVLSLAAGKFINFDDLTEDEDAAVNAINNAICQEAEHLAKDYPLGSKWAMRWSSYKADSDKVVHATITRVVKTGFGM